MMDLYMVVALAVIYGLFYGFTTWCERVIEDTGRNEL
ncbi:hypothetical protein J2T12_001498 [Paenibacillus anaericanus]|nr:hypothetical protein [Paenibacillus anaericanus]